MGKFLWRAFAADCAAFCAPAFFSGGCTVCLFIFFSSHSGLNRLDFFIFSFRRADGFSRPAVFIFPQRLPKRRVLFPLCLQKFSTILEKFLMARSILFLAYKKNAFIGSRVPKSSFVLRCLYYSANAPMLAAVQNSFWILELLPILWNFFSKIRVAQKKDRHVAVFFGKSNVIAVLLHRS